ncbi:uncharacterized protein B0H64DRAFT_378311 [Chaetomium fimeti]|uniref:Uncharacterized protein n=1 Tax=Chaetomium fimeti TaxID=1854472 RepID=A0AAE0LN51_9PEZI|nr:hypothetical protein B0H64DRAFT_378311 [Chaetomium fimeti]
MQLSFLWLSATALFSQAASGFYLKSRHSVLSKYGFASLNDRETTPAEVGFTFPHTYRPISIDLDENGNLSGDFVLRKVAQEAWALVSTATAGERQSTDITGPFALDKEREILYTGKEGLVWAVCSRSGHYGLTLVPRTYPDRRCVHDIELVAV